jgi:thermostable 8-oxoguanine DNA glycosylase
MDKKEKYIIVFNSAKQFLKDIIAKYTELNESILEKHLDHEARFDNIVDANKRLIESLSNRNMMASVINFKGKEEQLRSILCNYDPRAIINKYNSAHALFEVFKKSFEIRNVQSRRNLWRKFSEGIIAGSKLMSSFKDKEEFNSFIKTFALNKYTKAALPMLLSKEIKGFGLALACDFIKELGYRDYPKPDVHLIKIFSSLGLSMSTDPYEVYKSIIEMAEAVGEDAYTVDKIFWLISSGRFYLVDINTGRNRDEFIRCAKKQLDTHDRNR